MNSTSKNVSILVACQALLFTNHTTTIAINGWNMLNYLAIAQVLIIVCGLLWLVLQGRQGGTAMPVQS